MRKLSSPITGVGIALALALHAQEAHADDFFTFSPASERVLPKELDLSFNSTEAPGPTNRPDRIRLFRIFPGFLSDPLGLDDDTPPFAPDGTPLKAIDDGPSWVQVAVGNDNPYFDVRHPTDPGGIGYTRLQTQVQLLDMPSTSCTVGFQAVTPTGAQQGGIEDGPTVISPAFSLFHSLSDGTAFQGFVAKDLHVVNAAGLSDTLAHPGQLNRGVQYGMAVQRPVLPDMNNLYVFVEALGQYRVDTVQATSLPNIELLPGMHLKVSDNWWLSGGLILPVNQSRPIDAHLWQITCSFQF
jgi:hypothetical protein